MSVLCCALDPEVALRQKTLCCQRDLPALIHGLCRHAQALFRSRIHHAFPLPLLALSSCPGTSQGTELCRRRS